MSKYYLLFNQDVKLIRCAKGIEWLSNFHRVVISIIRCHPFIEYPFRHDGHFAVYEVQSSMSNFTMNITREQIKGFTVFEVSNLHCACRMCTVPNCLKCQFLPALLLSCLNRFENLISTCLVNHCNC